VDSWSEPPEALFAHRRWWLRSRSGEISGPVEWLEWRAQGRGLQVRLHGVGNRDDAARLTGALVEVPREALPALAAGEYYRADLVGCSVVNLEGVELGVVEHFVDAPGNAVMVVRDCATAGPRGEARERWLPVTPQHLRRVDLAARRVCVDWPEDF
jgi:16S rRNA processing protein RimM